MKTYIDTIKTIYEDYVNIYTFTVDKYNQLVENKK